MSRLFHLKSVLAAAIVTTGLAAFGNSAEAGGFCRTRPIGIHYPVQPIQHCRYETVIDYEFRTVDYVERIAKYRPCGSIYFVDVVRTKLVKVPVERLVKVCY